MGDKIKVTILQDGTLKIETDQISPANHVSAERLLDQITKLMGGEVTKARREHGHTHVHDHDHHHAGH